LGGIPQEFKSTHPPKEGGKILKGERKKMKKAESAFEELTLREEMSQISSQT